MKEVLKIISVLTIICIICAFFLSFVDNLAKEQIQINALRKKEAAISTLAPEAETKAKLEIEDEVIYKLANSKNELIGYAFFSKGQGYQGNIEILAIIDPSLEKLKGIEILESNETPGLGSKIQEEPFKVQFANLSVSEKIECLKEKPSKQNQIKAITGATVSSKAVVNILNSRIERIKTLIKQK